MKLFEKIFCGFIGGSSAARMKLHNLETCPHCGSQLAWETVAETDWDCPNPDCPPQVQKRVVLWASPKAMNICGVATAQQLVERGLVRDAAEFYRLKLTEIASLDGMSKEAAQQFFDSITASMKREAWRVLSGLGIRNIGPMEAQAICKHFVTLDDLFSAGHERLAKLDGVTEVVAHSLTHWYGDPVNRKLVRRLEKAGVNFKTTK